jgi:hypothetical protein
MCPHSTIHVSSYYYISLRVFSYYYMCPHDGVLLHVCFRIAGRSLLDDRQQYLQAQMKECINEKNNVRTLQALVKTPARW